MPMHDWTRVESGTYHNFHFAWIGVMMHRLNQGLLPEGFFAMAEQRSQGPIADVLTLSDDSTPHNYEGYAFQTEPTCQVVEQAEKTLYTQKSHRIAIKHQRGRVVAFIELVSPGNKDTRRALKGFTSKAVRLLERGTHLSVIDPFPPGRFDKQGIHRAIWDEVTSDSSYVLPEGNPLISVSYEAGEMPAAYVNAFHVGGKIPELAIFLAPSVHILLPLETTYQASWELMPKQIREAVIGSGN